MGQKYEQVAQLLAVCQIENPPAEVHGLVCGQISSGSGNLKTAVTAQLLGLDEAAPAVIEELLQGFSREIAEQIEGGDFTFQPLLPDDDEELSLRVYALGKWCEGFNVGFAGGFGRGDDCILEETREVLSDFARIAQVEDRLDDAVAAQEEQEEDYTEIVEYVRMAATSVYLQNTVEETLQVPKDPPKLH